MTTWFFKGSGWDEVGSMPLRFVSDFSSVRGFVCIKILIKEINALYGSQFVPGN